MKVKVIIYILIGLWTMRGCARSLDSDVNNIPEHIGDVGSSDVYTDSYDSAVEIPHIDQLTTVAPIPGIHNADDTLLKEESLEARNVTVIGNSTENIIISSTTESLVNVTLPELPSREKAETVNTTTVREPEPVSLNVTSVETETTTTVLAIVNTTLVDNSISNDTILNTTTTRPSTTFREVVVNLGDIIRKAPNQTNQDKFVKHNVTSSLKKVFIPNNCSQFKKLPLQPTKRDTSVIKKCCPIGQNYQYKNGNRFCGNETIKFNVSAINAVFYENCIEDEERNANLTVVVENHCNRGFIYNKHYDDDLYVLQNGSLLRVDANFASFDIYNHYCLDMDSEEKVLTAVVCGYDDLLLTVNKGQALIFAICMLISVPCLIITASLYLMVPELNDLHGKSLACHSFCLALGFFLLAFSQLREGDFLEGTLGSKIGYIIQWCIISCFFWLTNMWIDICVHSWYHLPRGSTTQNDSKVLAYYSIIAFGIPLIFVLLSWKSGFNGLPSYYYRGTTEIGRSCQMFFIPPISFTLCVNFLLYIASYFGFRKLHKLQLSAFLSFQLRKCPKSVSLSAQNRRHIKKVETMEKSTFYLTVVMTVNWIFEIISFYVETPFIIFDILNSLQGLIIFLIFICMPRPLRLIKRWWKDRGSFQVPAQNSRNNDNSNNNATEMELMKINPSN